MKLGLVRHFKVKHKLPGGFLIGHGALVEWFEGYDKADLIINPVDMGGIDWKLCYASSMSRACQTASHIYTGDITFQDELREINVINLLNKKLRLPILIWALLIKRKTLSANVITAEVEKKLDAFLDNVEQNTEKEILIVSHGFIMMLLQKKLTSRGFTGQKFINPANGKVYLFEKN
ncbi:histidine phosphatase family protein [Emticicia sp. 21SJ11W-3]|uniref:histidine phosphatase family protein n=1 Tax=Emticicia sp. 21SJ11W-3 TaxID=2916755 RepID=UPI00209E7025|nr:histidine phosphatase family protein [Emticicia sp. 21SJ11W-3]UTA66602.1 phosphoglycerate mutase family protein [Emticicia sp. 21SJ11W-3]